MQVSCCTELLKQESFGKCQNQGRGILQSLFDASIAKQYNNQLIGRYRNAICFIIDEDTCFSSMDETLATEPFKVVSEAHVKRVKGFPLDSISVDIATGKYYYDLDEKSVDQSAIEQGVRAFFKQALRGTIETTNQRNKRK